MARASTSPTSCSPARRSLQHRQAGRPNTILLDPQILDNTTDQGKADLQKWISVPGMDPLWPLSLSIPGWTDYDPMTVPATCKGA